MVKLDFSTGYVSKSWEGRKNVNICGERDNRTQSTHLKRAVHQGFVEIQRKKLLSGVVLTSCAHVGHLRGGLLCASAKKEHRAEGQNGVEQNAQRLCFAYPWGECLPPRPLPVDDVVAAVPLWGRVSLGLKQHIMRCTNDLRTGFWPMALLSASTSRLLRYGCKYTITVSQQLESKRSSENEFLR